MINRCDARPQNWTRLHEGGHLIVRLGDKMSVLPMHGKQKELGAGLVNAIKKDLGLK